jgi:hypothetical protein
LFHRVSKDEETDSEFVSSESFSVSGLAEKTTEEEEEDKGDTKCEPELFPPKYWTGRFNYSPPVEAASQVSETRQPGQAMFGTIATQREIWRHQHPSSCENKKFLVYLMLGWANGIGSSLHVATVALRLALDTDRILILYPTPNHRWMKGKFCDDYDTMDACYFEPFTSCSIYDIFGGKLPAWDEIPAIDLGGGNEQSNLTVLSSHVNSIGSYFQIISGAPDRFLKFFPLSGMRGDHWYHWWRAQAVAYMVRPNLRTLRELDSRRQLLFRNKPIDPGTISIHIRHGDKWKESTLVADEVYLRLAEELLEKFPDIATRNIFLSTEDPNSVQFFAKVTNWNVSWTNVSRVDDSTISPMDYAERIGWTEEYLNSLLSLELALECDAFVGMYSSNWNRLINELRSTVRCKSHFPYVDVHQGWYINDCGW